MARRRPYWRRRRKMRGPKQGYHMGGRLVDVPQNDNIDWKRRHNRRKKMRPRRRGMHRGGGVGFMNELRSPQNRYDRRGIRIGAPLNERVSHQLSGANPHPSVQNSTSVGTGVGKQQTRFQRKDTGELFITILDCMSSFGSGSPGGHKPALMGMCVEVVLTP